MQSDLPNLYIKFLKVKKISTDTRLSVKDTIFFCLKGKNFDGNEYIFEALEKGCIYAVTDSVQFKQTSDERIIYVQNVYKTLQKLANFHRKNYKIPIIAITGSNGKTTTKELCASVLSTKYNVLKTEANLNNQLGLSLTLLKLAQYHELAVIQIGVSCFGDMKQLLQILQPNYGIITNIGKSHLENFLNLDGVFKEKTQLYKFLEHQTAKIFINLDNDMLVSAAQNNIKIPYSISKKAEINGKIITSDPTLRMVWTQLTQHFQIQTKLLGSYNIQNIVAAISIARHFDVPHADINKAISEYTPNNLRSQYKNTQRNHLIIDTYNSNPSSMEASFSSFEKMDVFPKMCILGSMLSIGEKSQEEHLKILRRVEENKYRGCFVGDKFPKSVNFQDAQYFKDVGQLIQYLRQEPISGYYIFIKGSNSNRLQKVIDFL